MSDENVTVAGIVAGGNGTGSAAAGQGTGEIPVFDQWIEKQDEGVRTMLDGHVKGLKSALETERENRKSFEKQVKELAQRVEKGSEAEKRLNELSAQIELDQQRMAFYEDAQKQGISNLKAAFTLAQTDQLFDRKGNADFDKLKSAYPELFKKPVPAGNAGEGAEGQPATFSMNDAIRRMAGRT